MKLKLLFTFLIILMTIFSVSGGYIPDRCSLNAELNCYDFSYELNGSYVNLRIAIESNKVFENLKIEIPNCNILNKTIEGNNTNFSFSCVPNKSNYLYHPPGQVESNRFSYFTRFNVFDNDKFITRGGILVSSVKPPENFKPSLILDAYLSYYGLSLLLFLGIPLIILVIILIKRKKKK